MVKNEDAESMIATTIGRLELAMKAPAILHAASIKAIKDDLVEWFEEHNQITSNHSPVSVKSDNDWSSLAEAEMKNLLDAHEALNREELGKALQRIRILVGTLNN